MLVGKHTVITRVLKGTFNSRPPQLRYKSTWNVSLIINWLNSINNAGTEVTLLNLAIKVVALIARLSNVTSPGLVGQLSYLVSAINH